MGEFTSEEWESIFAELKKNPKTYGFPIRTPGSALMGSFNIRKLGNADNRSNETWKFLGLCCKCYDIIAIQEALDNMDGLYRLLDELNGEYKMICSDKTGTYPGDNGLGERMVFFFRPATVDLGEVVSDVTYDRTKVTQIMFENLDEIVEAKNKYERSMEDYRAGRRKTKPKLDAPIFMSFIRQPFCSSFIIKGENAEEYEPFKLMAINAHLMYGTSKDRWREFEALMHWIRDRVVNQEKMYFPNYVLLGDLNLDYDNPERDFAKMEELVKNIDGETADEIQINFPFLDIHPHQEEHFTSNIVLTQRYDQIGMFFSDSDGEGRGFPTKKENETMGKHEDGPDYGVFNFTELFAKALQGESYKDMSKTSQKAFIKRYTYEVSDHMPVWLRLKFTPKSTSNKRMRVDSPTSTSDNK